MIHNRFHVVSANWKRIWNRITQSSRFPGNFPRLNINISMWASWINIYILTKDVGRSGLCLVLSKSAKSLAEKSASGLAAGWVPKTGESDRRFPESSSQSFEISNSGNERLYELLNLFRGMEYQSVEDFKIEENFASIKNLDISLDCKSEVENNKKKKLGTKGGLQGFFFVLQFKKDPFSCYLSAMFFHLTVWEIFEGVQGCDRNVLQIFFEGWEVIKGSLSASTKE